MPCRILGVIPARYASTRFPGKPLAEIAGKPMVQWVYEAAVACSDFSEVTIATDDDRIGRAIRQFGGNFVTTGSDHETGTDRVAEVAEQFHDVDVVVNIQGDQPFVTADMLHQLVAPYVQGESPEMTTLACPLPDAEAMADSHTVKVICDQKMNAIYFSRAAIPYYRTPAEAPVYHHLGLYGYRRDFLARFAGMPPTPLEKCEQLEQLRAIEHGFRIRVSIVPAPMIEVNTPADLDRANQSLQSVNGATTQETDSR